MRASEHASLLEALSERLLSDFSQEFWRKVFLGPGHESLHFERETLTFLCTDTLEFDWTPQEMETLAARHQGRIERFDQRVVLALPQAGAALQLALLLQRGARCGLRMALVTVGCMSAVFEQDGRARRLAVGPEVRQACESADRLRAGTIHLSAGTCAELGPASAWPSQAARLVHVGSQDDPADLDGVTLSLTPRALSTATAGLALA
jgi:hypothetical protein